MLFLSPIRCTIFNPRATGGYLWQRAECNIHVKGSDMFAESSHEDLYAAVDELVDKLDRQVVRHKDRVKDHHHEAPKRLM